MIRTLPVIFTLFVLGCASGPDYRRPDASVPTTWKEGAGWRLAAPDDAVERGPWWTVFRDPDLDALERQVEVSNQNLRAVEAAWREAAAVLAGARAGYAPTVGAGASAQRTGTGPMPTSDAVSRAGGPRTSDRLALNGTVSWAPDLWGRIRRTVESGQANLQASAADLASARLSAQASLATLYVSLRALDEQRRLLEAIATADERALAIARHQHDAGLVSRADVLQAEAQLAGVRAQTVGLGVQRAQAEHAIAVLVGRPPAALTIASREGLLELPVVPIMVPSALLERRPDLASSERRMAAANAQIGVAQAAYYPDLSLSGALGYAGAAAGSLISAPDLLWSAGAQATATLFDGGARDAKVAQARAAWDQAVATYRQTVLAAFQQTEDQLAAGRILAEQATAADQAVAAAVEAEQVSLNQYQAGTVGYASVLLAQNATRSYRLSALQIRAERLATAVVLIESLGGGWNAARLSASPSNPDIGQAALAKPQTP